MRRPRFPWLTALAAAALLLLPALAWLQYSWLNQVADADRERRQRTLDTAVVQLGHELDLELSRAFFALQIESSIVESGGWAAYRQRFDSWAASTKYGDIVERVYLAEPTRSGASSGVAPRLRAWNPRSGAFEDAAWPTGLEPLRAQLSVARTHVDVRSNGARAERILLPPMTGGDERTLVAPILRLAPPAPGFSRPRAPDGPQGTLLGFTLVRFDLDRVAAGLLRDLVGRHFQGEDGSSEYRVAVVERDHPERVVFESPSQAARIAAASPDAEGGLLAIRNNPVFLLHGGRARLVQRRTAEPPPERAGPGDRKILVSVIEGDRGDAATGSRVFGGDGAHWRLVVKHRAGSLEAAVAAGRRRSLALSSAILGLLAVAVGLIVVSARRAARLATQQVEFVAAVSHELRTPVSVIGAAAGNLADGIVADPARVRTYGQTIQAEARRLTETVERVLQLAGILSGRPASPGTLAPGALVDAAIAACRHEIDAAGTQVEVDVPVDLPAVSGDVVALRSALQNLVSNAIKYGGDSRWVRVSARAARHGGRPMVEIDVQDRGLGIEADDRARIFEAFARGRAATTHQIQGSGLGLNLVRRIAEAHGGTVIVSSEPGRGSTFTLRLPAAHGDVPDRAGAALSSLGTSR